MANISINDITTSNETGTATFTVTLSEAVGSDVTVDFTTSSQTLNFTKAVIDTSADGAKDVYVADMDGDGDLDVVSASYNDNTIAWYENDGAANPSWTAADIATSAGGAWDVHVADMDGDGDFDDDNEDRLALNSQVRFQNDLLNDNLTVKTSGDFDGDGFQEVYWKTNNGDIYLRSLMHADGNIQYANYQNQAQMSDYLTAQGHESIISDII